MFAGRGIDEAGGRGTGLSPCRFQASVGHKGDHGQGIPNEASTNGLGARSGHAKPAGNPAGCPRRTLRFRASAPSRSTEWSLHERAPIRTRSAAKDHCLQHNAPDVHSTRRSDPGLPQKLTQQTHLQPCASAFERLSPSGSAADQPGTGQPDSPCRPTRGAESTILLLYNHGSGRDLARPFRGIGPGCQPSAARRFPGRKPRRSPRLLCFAVPAATLARGGTRSASLVRRPRSRVTACRPPVPAVVGVQKLHGPPDPARISPAAGRSQRTRIGRRRRGPAAACSQHADCVVAVRPLSLSDR